MKINKKVKIIAGSVLGIFLLFFIVLVVHIATTKPIVIDNASIQISRIDFKEPIDSLKAKEIHRNIKQILGVKTDKLNIETGVLVFFHDNKIADSKSVFNQLIAMGNYKAERFIVPEKLANNKVCPVITDDSFTYKFSSFVQRIF